MPFRSRLIAASARIVRRALAFALGCVGGVCGWSQELFLVNPAIG